MWILRQFEIVAMLVEEWGSPLMVNGSTIVEILSIIYGRCEPGRGKICFDTVQSGSLSTRGPVPYARRIVPHNKYRSPRRDSTMTKIQPVRKIRIE